MIPTQFCGDFLEMFFKKQVGTKKCLSSRKGIKKAPLSFTWALLGALTLNMSSCHVQKPRGSKFAHPSFRISVESCGWSNNPFGILENIFLVKTFLEKSIIIFNHPPPKFDELFTWKSLSNKKEKNWLKLIEIIINSGETIFNFRGIESSKPPPKPYKLGVLFFHPHLGHPNCGATVSVGA